MYQRPGRDEVMYSREVIDEVISRNDIVDVISGYVKLKRMEVHIPDYVRFIMKSHHHFGFRTAAVISLFWMRSWW